MVDFLGFYSGIFRIFVFSWIVGFVGGFMVGVFELFRGEIYI